MDPVHPGNSPCRRGRAYLDAHGWLVLAALGRPEETEPTRSLITRHTIRSGRRELENNSGISGKQLLEWANRADLFRIKGVGEEYSDLLERAGVDTVPELARRNAANLYKAMAEVNEGKNIVRQLPGQKQVANWVSQAKELPRKIEY